MNDKPEIENVETLDALEALADAREKISKFARDRERLISEHLPAEVREKLAEMDSAVNYYQALADALEAGIKSVVLETGQTAKGRRLMAVYSRVVSYDNKKLEALGLVYPALATIRVEKPSVSIRKVSRK